MVKKLALWLVFVVALLLQFWLLYFDLPHHISLEGFWIHVAVAVSLIFLPLTLFALFARLPIGRRYFKQRFIITPFQTIKANSTYNGAALAALLFRDICSWRSETTGRVGDSTVSSLPQQATFSFAGTSLPLNWLWSQLRRLIIGRRDIVIEGLLEDADEPLRLKAWTDILPETWMAELSSERFATDILAAISTLTLRILRALDPLLLARIYWVQGNYADAIDLLCLQDRSTNSEIDLIRIYVECGRNDVAITRLDQIKRRRFKVSSPLQIEIADLHAQILANLGDFSNAITVIQEELGKSKKQRHALYSRLGDVYAYDVQFDLAIEAYRKSEQEAWQEISRLLRVRIEEFQQLIDRLRDVSPPIELEDILWKLYFGHSGSARCSKLQGNDPLPQYIKAAQALKALRELNSQPARAMEQCDAIIHKAAAQHLSQTNNQQCFEYNLIALDFYDQSIELSQFDLQSDQDDLRVITDLAWSYCGKYACLQRLLSNFQVPISYQHDVVETLSRLIRELSAQRVSHFNSALQSATAYAKEVGKEYSTAITKAAGRLINAMLIEMDAERVGFWIDQLAEIEVSEVGKQLSLSASEAGISDEIIRIALQQPSFTEASQRFGNDLFELYRTIVRLLNLVARLQQPEEVENLIKQVDWRIDRDQTLRLFQSQLNQLGVQKDRHHRAEYAYALACLNSIDYHVEDAVAWLIEAISLTRGSNRSCSYISRARMDEDFDVIRQDESFRRVVYK